MNFRYSRIALFILFLFCYLSSNATHIVGGVMNYRYLGNNNFEISLFVFVDCKNGAISFDNQAIVSVYDGNNDLIKEEFFQINRDSFNIDPTIFDPCVTSQPNVCIRGIRYRQTINLPPSSTGYTIAYQRCCRNNSILNITKGSFSGNTNTIEWGATYSVNIPPSINGQHINNSSPAFVNYPPAGICLNKELVYDHSAIDTDGDSLVYKICTPFDGANPDFPTSTTPPPFDTIVWRSTNGYSLNNVLGGIPLSINPRTGLLTCTPNRVGQFVVGVCVEEYRNRILLTKTVRDFQFNVEDCGLKVISSFFAPNLQCNNLTVNFTNNSIGATTYKWYFGDGDSSILQNPAHTYAAGGTYNVTLVCNQGQSCFATSTQTVTLRIKRIEANFTAENIACLKQDDTIRFLDQSVDAININQWRWSFSNGATSTLRNPFIIYNGVATSITATLTVNSPDGCTSTITKTIDLLKKITTNLPDSIVTCVGNSVVLPLSVTPNTNNIYSWSPATGLNNSTIQTPTATVNTNTTYVVTVTNNQTCILKDTIQVKIKTINQNLVPDTLKFCKEQVRVLITRNVTNVQWSTNSNFTPIISTSNPLIITQVLPIVKYYVKATVDGCIATDSIIVLFNDTTPTIQLPDSITFCNVGEPINIIASVNKYDSLYWSNNSNFNPYFNKNILSFPTTTSIKTYYLKAFYKGCFSIDSIQIKPKPKPIINISDSFYVCADSVRLVGRISNYDSVKWSFEPTITDVFATTPSIIVSQTEAEKMYYLKVYYLGCVTTDSFRVLYNDTTPKISLSSPKRFCSDSVFAYAFVDFYTNVEWYNSRDLSQLIGTNLTLQITQPQGKRWYYFKADYKFCSAIDSIELENVSIKYSKQNVAVCDGKSATLNLNIQTPAQYDIIWYANNDTFETNNISSLIILPQNTQTVYFSINNIFGCKVNDSLLLTVYPIPAVDATVDKPIIFRGEQVQLNATQGEGYSYNWTPIDLVSNTSIFNPTSSPIQNTLYTVVVSNTDLCVNEDTVSVQVLDYKCSTAQIFIPNAFTPNGDGQNDVFKVKSGILRKMHLEIYNRWGNKVFETDDINNGWNGTYKGQPEQEDAYAYYFVGECLQGESITLKGNVTLLK